MGSAWSQIWPPPPKFTDKEAADQHGKVFIVTGASGGVGKQLAQLLYKLNGKVYIASRNRERVEATMCEIREAVPQSRGELYFLPVNLEDLESVEQAASTFLAKEDRLDALWNNAGVMMPPAGSQTKQGYELQLGVHCLAHFLLTQLLTPLMIQTAKSREPGSVRVLWVASSAAELFSPANGGVDLNNLDYKKPVPAQETYAISKAGMVLLSQEYAARHRQDGIISVSMNPGNNNTDMRRHVSWPLSVFFGWMSWDPINGAYTELYAGLSEDISLDASGCWVIPWGRISPVRKDIRDAGNPTSAGGTGLGAKFWDWCESQVASFRPRE